MNYFKKKYVQAKFGKFRHIHFSIRSCVVFESLPFFLSKLRCFTAFVNNTEGFPKPLSKEKERELLVAFHEKNDSRARSKLINHNLRLVSHIVKKYAGSVSIEVDDLISVGTIGLIKAIDSFKYEKGAGLATYASKCIDNEILMLIRVNKKHKDTISLSSKFASDKEGNEVLLMDVLESDEDEVEDAVSSSFLMEKINQSIEKHLSKREKEILNKRYGLNGEKIYTQKELAEKMGISRSYVSRIEAKALDLIKDDLAKNYYDKI